MLSAEQAGDDSNRGRVILSLGGCIDYSFQGGKGQTTFNFILKEKDIGHMGLEILPRSIPIGKLVLLPQPLGIYAK